MSTTPTNPDGANGPSEPASGATQTPSTEGQGESKTDSEGESRSPSGAHRASQTDGNAPPADPRRLYRRSDDRMIGGLASGIASHVGVDPVFTRAAFVLLSFAGGAGIALYIVGILLVPQATAGAPVAPPARLEGRARRVFTIGLLVVAGLWIMGASDGAFWPVLLIGVGVYLLRDTPPVTAPEGPPGAGVTTPAYGGPTFTTTTATPPAAPRQRSDLGPIAVGLALLATGIGVALDRTDVVNLDAAQIIALPVLIFGGALLVGTWAGRARWLAALALPLVLVGAIASATDGLSWDEHDQDTYSKPTKIAEIQSHYQQDAGEITVDLSAIPITPEPISTTVRLGAGKIAVVLPPGRPYVVEGHVGLGEVELLGQRAGGPDSDLTIDSATGIGGPVRLDLSTGLGVVRLLSEPLPSYGGSEPEPTDSEEDPPVEEFEAIAPYNQENQ